MLRNEIDQILLIVLEWFPDKEHFEEYALKKEVDMLKDKGQLSFEDKWPSMRPTILKLLRQETVTRGEWHDLFWLVHSVCLWDEKGPPKVYSALRDVRFQLYLLAHRIASCKKSRFFFNGKNIFRIQTQIFRI